MDTRKQNILNIIIKEHIKTGFPVGSGILVDKYKLNISPATVRNEMAELENQGFIAQPYTSAGRVPTEKAYNLYIENLNQRKEYKENFEEIKEILKIKNEQNFKQTAKAIAEISGNAVFWAFHRNNLYYTGISNLLAQPEFINTNLIHDISSVIDRLDEIIDGIYNGIEDNPQIFIGSDNPFGKFCGTVLTRYKFKENIGMFGILGPIRMDYEKNLALIKFVNNLVNNISN
ncbi:MAG: hypothetical protein ABIA02_02805 [Candidatus Falkowbacteria bacterium]